MLRRACGHEQHRVVIADAANGADEGLGAIEHAAEFAPAMAVLEDPDAGTVEIPDRLLRFTQHSFGQDSRPGREVELPQFLSSQ